MEQVNLSCLLPTLVRKWPRRPTLSRDEHWALIYEQGGARPTLVCFIFGSPANQPADQPASQPAGRFGARPRAEASAWLGANVAAPGA